MNNGTIERKSGEWLFDGYFLWLCGLMDISLEQYSELFYILYDTDFLWVTPTDSDRADDGLEMRRKYYEQDREEDWIMFIDDGCSVLEALVGIACRMNFLIESEETGDMSRVWFWDMIRNLGLAKFNNMVLINSDGSSNDDQSQAVIDILNRWMMRQFEPDGTGSIFPLSNPKSDQRYETINMQMNLYAQANYLE